jgi:carbonic anhydrase/acetyltransferase-like protein (isoleucine patch superfamily)
MEANEHMTVDEIMAAAQDNLGWRKLTNGRTIKIGFKVKLGNGAVVGDRAVLGNWAVLGNGAVVGNGAELGNWVELGNWAELGNGAVVGDRAVVGDGAVVGDRAVLGNGAVVGDGVVLGNGVQLGDLVTCTRTPLQVQCHPYPVYPNSPTKVGVGCLVRDIGYWLRSEDPDELAEHTECQPWSTYRAAIALVVEFGCSVLSLRGPG